MAQQLQVAPAESKPKFSVFNNLVAEKLGGRILFATDDFFAVADNLLKESEPEWREGEFTEFGKWMDGWETRRKRKAGHDWCIIKLGVPGVIEGVDVDTCHFTGNFAPQVSLQAAVLTPDQEKLIPKRCSQMGSEASESDMTQVAALKTQEWETIIPQSKAAAGYPPTRHSYFPSTSSSRYTHLRLNIYPDGGIARLRVFGYAVPDWSAVPDNKEMDLASVLVGGVCVEYSDAHYGHPRNLINPLPGVGMADGWETARRLDRPPVLRVDSQGFLQGCGHEWTVLRLGHPGNIVRVEVDTNHFKGNFPESVKIDGCLLQPNKDTTNLCTFDHDWKPLLPRQKLGANARHFYKDELKSDGPVSHVRVIITPDGGLSRVRIYGNITPLL